MLAANLWLSSNFKDNGLTAATPFTVKTSGAVSQWSRCQALDKIAEEREDTAAGFVSQAITSRFRLRKLKVYL